MPSAFGEPSCARPNPSAASTRIYSRTSTTKSLMPSPPTTQIAGFLADAVVVCLNSDPHHLIANFPPTIETIQDEVLHALRSYGFQNTADAYACYRWGRHWLREGAITAGQVCRQRFSARADGASAGLEPSNAAAIPSPGSTKSCAAASSRAWSRSRSRVYEQSLDEAAAKVMARLNAGDQPAHDVGQRPEFFRQNHHHRQAHRAPCKSKACAS